MKLKFYVEYDDDNPKLGYPKLCIDREAYESLLEEHKCTRYFCEERFITKCCRHLGETSADYEERKKSFRPTFTNEASLDLYPYIYNKSKQRWSLEVYWDVVRMSSIWAYWEKDEFLHFKVMMAKLSDGYKPKQKTFACFEQALEYLETEHRRLKLWGISTNYKEVFDMPAPYTFHDYTKERI
jgi:hypothetical protein